MDAHVVLNEEISIGKDGPMGNSMGKDGPFGSLSSNQTSKINTLDEPILTTMKRDASIIFEKIQTVLSGEGNYQKIRREWDLWGPLVISLVTASLCAFETEGTREEAFTNIFIGMWVGPLVITLNTNLLGAKSPIIQTLCLIIYCSAPMMFLAMVVFVLNALLRWFFLNLLVSVAAVVFTLKCSQAFFKSLVPEEKRLLSLFPVLLFYAFMGVFISMT